MTRLQVLALALSALMAPTVSRAQAVASAPRSTFKTEHGTAWMAVPSQLFSIHYDATGATTVSGSPFVLAGYSNSASPCLPVQEVYSTFGGGKGVEGAGAKQSFYGQPLCSFPANGLTLGVSLDTSRITDQVCWQEGSNAPKGTNEHARLAAEGKYKGPPPHLVTGWSETESYSVGMTMTYQNPQVTDKRGEGGVPTSVAVSCDKATCVQWAGPTLPQASEGQAYSVHLFTGAVGATTTKVLSGLPPGLSLGSDGTLSGVPTQAGHFELDVDMWDQSNCSWHHFTGEGGSGTLWGQRLSLTVKGHEPPQVSSFTVSPDTLPSNGGDVVTTIKAADKVGVTSVYLSLTQPDGHVGGGVMPLTSGTTANGTWTMTWTTSPNAANKPVSYTVTIRLSDKDGNTLQLPPKTITVSGAPSRQQIMKGPPKSH